MQVLAAVNAAVGLCSPLLVYPVTDTKTCDGLLARPGHPLASCVIMRPHSTPQDLYTSLKLPPFSALQGDYVRCECRETGGTTRPMRKDEVIRAHQTDVVCVMTNRKSAWQRKGRDGQE